MIWLAPLSAALLMSNASIRDRIIAWINSILPKGRIISTEPFGPPAPPPKAVNGQDLDTLARTLWGEARSEGERGMQAVANVIMNRFKKAQSSTSAARQFGRTVHEICLKPYQFSCWLANDPNLPKMRAVTAADANFRLCLNVAERALKGQLPDITGGADHYLNVPVTIKIRGGTLPPWVDMNKRTASIGDHTFLRLA